ncbi:ESPR domain-containing protein [Dialister sp. i34-0019-2H8]|uniref:ESPR domain-containing protein n=1 Tax=Dialister sp. i34-0019-2H8 TaxID=3141190 RepID=UPI0034BE56AA
MNHIYKVIWNKAKHCYTVVSEIAKSHSQSNKRVRSMTAVVAAAMMLTGFGGMAIEAANPAPDDTNIKIGKGADFAIWNGQTGHDGITSGYIAIGENAYAWDGEYSFQDYLTRKWSARIGTKEYLLDFNQGAVGSATWGKYRVTDGTKLAGAIAIGKNTMARTGSVMIGDHTYVGKLGDIEVDPAKKMTLNDSVYSTTLGSSSYNSGSMSAVTGAFSIISNKGTSTSYGTQNFGATIYGSLNSIESSSASSHSAGMANSVLGFGNRTQNTNASLVWGTGNEVTNSIENVTFSTKWNKTSASDAQKEIIKAMQSSDQYAGGSVMAIGGGNKADWAIYSQLLGVQNTLTGTEKDVSKLTVFVY